jgi:hypothetical protein
MSILVGCGQPSAYCPRSFQMIDCRQVSAAPDGVYTQRPSGRFPSYFDLRP